MFTQCEMYVKGLLLNNKSMTVDRIHEMLKILSIATGGSANGSNSNNQDIFNYDLNPTQLRNFLNTLIDKNLIEYIDGSYQLIKK